MLLFDANLSYRIPEAVSEHFPGATHVNALGLEKGTDTVIWEKAKENGLTIVSKNDDFLQRGLVIGAPPKVIIVKAGNIRTRALIDLIILKKFRIREFIHQSEESVMILGEPPS